MTINSNDFRQADGSLLYPNGRIITAIERQKLITDSENTPVRARVKDIKDIIEDASVSILIGETGSGKTTELPQMIHEVFPNDMVITNIPLVSATIGTATYVSDILCAKTGNPYYIFGNGGIGYRTGKGYSSTDRSQLTYNTYGLDYLHLSLGNYERFLNSGNKNIHIVLDEIHEKSEDFVFYLSKIIDLSKKYPGRIKLYGASATVSDDYLNILSDKFKELSNYVPVTKVEGRTFDVEVIEENGANIVEEVVGLYKNGKSVLIFEPGVGEIERTIGSLQTELGDEADIVPFHSSISKEELAESLKNTGKQKIIVATNAARTGVTLDINAVVDSGKQKSQYYDYKSGVAILTPEDIPHDAYMQNRGRAGRKEEGIAEYVGTTKIEDLKLEALSSVEIKVDEKKILMELIDGNNILSNESKGIHKYLFNPNKTMLKFSYEWMKASGLITKNEKITKYGFDVLKFPLSVFNGRILLESIENGVADDIIPMISIIENRGFLTREFNEKKFGKNILKSEYSDLEIYTKLFDILNSTEVEDDILKMFIGLGIEGSTIDYFRSLDGEEKLYKVLGKELDNIGFKLKNIERIDETIEKIKKYLENNNDYANSLEKELEDDEKQLLIQRSLLSGNLHNIYSSIGKKLFESYGISDNELEFEQSDTSFIDTYSGQLYIGEPFIVGGTGDKDDKPLFSLITQIEAGDIEFFDSKQYEEYKVPENNKSIEKFSVDDSGNTFVVPKEIKQLEDKQRYVALNWLPHFLVKKNKFFKNFIKNAGGNFDEDKFIKIVEEVTFAFSDKIDPNNKVSNVDIFKDDKVILGLVLKSEELESMLSGEKVSNLKLEQLDNNNSEFFDYARLNNEYNKTLNEAKRYIENNSINIDLLTENILNIFIESLENKNSDYSELIIFIKKLSNKKNNNQFKKELKESFSSYNKENQKLIEQKIRNSWVISFLNNLKKIKTGDNVTIKDFSIGKIDDKRLLLSDPLVKKNKFGDKANKLQKQFKGIKKLLNKINIEEKDINHLFISIQKGLFFDKRKYKRGMQNLEQSFINFKTIKEKNLSDIATLENNKVGNNAEKTNKRLKELNIENSNIDLLINKLNNFKENILNIRDSVESINFKNIIFNSDTQNLIYTKKFLYNVLIDVIFEGDFIALDDKQESKLISRLELNFKNSNINISELVGLIKNTQALDFKNEKIDNTKKIVNNTSKGTKGILKSNSSKTSENEYDRSFYENKLNNYISKIEDILIEYKKENKELESNIYNNHSTIISLINNIEGIFSDFYPKNIIELHENKILNLAKKIYNISMNNIDEELKKVLISMPLIKSKKYEESFSRLEEYRDLSDYILGLYTKEGLKENDDIDFVGELPGLSEGINTIKEKTKKIKDIIDNNK